MNNFPPVTQNPRGIFISRGIKLEPHEIDTINFLVSLGKVVEQIPPSNTPHNLQPDIFMDQLVWEMKSPTSSSHNALSHLFYKAVQQSANVIFDLRRLKVQNATIFLEKLFYNSRGIKNLLIITCDAKLLEYRKK